MSGAGLTKSVSVPVLTPLIDPRLWFPPGATVHPPAKRKITLPTRNESRCGLGLRELTRHSDELRSFIQSLRRIDYAATFAVRSLVGNILRGKLRNARVFISEGSGFASPTNAGGNPIAASVVYRPRDKWNSGEDIDNVATWAIGPDSALEHLRQLVAARRWHARGVVFVNFRANLLPALERVLPDPDRRYVTPQPPSRLYVSEPYTREELRKRFDQSSSAVPSNFVFDRLRPDDAEVVAENWDFERPRKLAYVLWLIDHFAGVCIRDRDNDSRPVSWSLINEFGAKGFKFVLPEYRRHGLSVVNMYALLLAASDPGFLPPQDNGSGMRRDQEESSFVFHAMVGDENEASIRSNAKARFVSTDTMCTRLVYRKRALFEQDTNRL